MSIGSITHIYEPEHDEDGELTPFSIVIAISGELRVDNPEIVNELRQSALAELGQRLYKYLPKKINQITIERDERYERPSGKGNFIYPDDYTLIITYTLYN